MGVGTRTEITTKSQNWVVAHLQSLLDLTVAVLRYEDRCQFVLHMDHHAVDDRKGVCEIAEILR